MFLDQMMDQLLLEGLEAAESYAGLVWPQDTTGAHAWHAERECTYFLRVANRVFRLTPRRSELELVRKGFGDDAFDVKEVVEEATDDTQEPWDYRFGLRAAPDGLLVRGATAGENFSGVKVHHVYGRMQGGSFHKLFGTSWHGERPFYERWTPCGWALEVEVINGKDVRLWKAGRKEERWFPHSFDLHLDKPFTELGTDEVALLLNKHLYDRNDDIKPDPGLYAADRWWCEDGVWRYA